MLLVDDEAQTPARKTLKRCSKTSWLQNDIYPQHLAHLLKYYLDHRARLVSTNRDFLAYYNLLTYLHLYISEIPYMYTRGES